ncbi:hypothetical protein HC928_00545 [bacterium]|nr:hypothetical protein [bacterium]
MSTKTPKLRMTLPEFNQLTWHDDVNGNFTTLDSVVGAFVNSAVMRGLWENNTLYEVNMLAIDSASAVLYRCEVEHTSASSGTFATDRTANPTYWVAATNYLSFPGHWTTGNEYYIGDLVSENIVNSPGANYDSVYVCIEQHTASALFQTDITAGKWAKLVSTKAIDTRLMTVESSLATAETDIDNLETAVTTAESDIDNLETAMTTAESDIDTLETAVTTAESDIDTLETAVTTAENDIDTLETTVSAIAFPVTSGVYTPTVGLVTNADSGSASSCLYMVIGDIVLVGLSIIITPTTASTTTEVTLTLPVAPTNNFSSSDQATGSVSTAAEDIARILATTGSANKLVRVVCVPSIAGAQTYRGMFMYRLNWT